MPIDRRVQAIPSSADKPGSRMPAHRIGCAGWSILSRHAALFGEGDSHLARYATRFNAVEINSSFYRPHAATTYARWAASVPRSFRFSVKLPKAVTHDARLRGAGDATSRFADEIAGLGQRLGGVLVQLPPSLAFDARMANAFFAMLRRRIVAPVACEPRHASWFEPRVDVIWMRYDIARVAADPARIPGLRSREARDAGRTGAGTVLRACITTVTTRRACARWPRACATQCARSACHGASSTTPPQDTRSPTPHACRHCWRCRDPDDSAQAARSACCAPLTTGHKRTTLPLATTGPVGAACAWLPAGSRLIASSPRCGRVVELVGKTRRQFAQRNQLLALADDLPLPHAPDHVSLDQMACHRKLRLHEARERGRIEHEEPRRLCHPHRRLVKVLIAGDVRRPRPAVHAALGGAIGHDVTARRALGHDQSP